MAVIDQWVAKQLKDLEHSDPHGGWNGARRESMMCTTDRLTTRFRALPVSEIAAVYEECDRDPERTAHELLVLAALADSQTAKRAKSKNTNNTTDSSSSIDEIPILTEQDEELLVSEYIWEEVNNNHQILTATANAASNLANSGAASSAASSSTSSSSASSSKTKTSKKENKKPKKNHSFWRRYHEKKNNKKQEKLNEERRLRAIHTLALQFPDLSVAEIEHTLREKQNADLLHHKQDSEHDNNNTNNNKKQKKNKKLKEENWLQNLPVQELMELSENKKITRVKTALMAHDADKDKEGHKCTVVANDLDYVITDSSDVDLEIRVVLAENEWSVEKATTVFQTRVTERQTKMKDKVHQEQLSTAKRDAWAQNSMHTIRNARKQKQLKVENEVEAQDTQAETLRKSRQQQVMLISRAQLAAELQRMLSVDEHNVPNPKYLPSGDSHQQPAPPSNFPSQTDVKSSSDAQTRPPVVPRREDDAETKLFVDSFIRARKQRAVGQKGRRAPSRFQSRIQT